MLDTPARLLQLLALLQARHSWSSAELADRLEVSTRTVRRDLDRLRSLGYGIETDPEDRHRYRLGVGAALPPLLFNDDDAIVVVLALRAAAATGLAGSDEAVSATLAKIDHLLPAHLRRRVATMRAHTTAAPGRGVAVVWALLADLSGT